MRTLAFLLCLLAPLAALPQDWFPTGATWHYGYNYGNGVFVGYVLHEVSGDTVLDGHACKVLQRTRETYNSGNYYTQTLWPLYVYDSVGVVWITSPYSAGFDTLYNLNAVPGDRWSLTQLPSYCDSTSYAEVVDTGSVVIDGVSLKWLAVDQWYPSSTWSLPLHDTIIERIGTRSYLLPQDPCLAAVDGSEGGGLRCYHDAEIDYSTGVATACDLILSLDEQVGAFSSRVFPNPGAEKVTIEWPGQPRFSVMVLDAIGRVVIERVVASGSVTLDTSGLSPGCYAVFVTTTSGARSTKQWIKQ